MKTSSLAHHSRRLLAQLTVPLLLCAALGASAQNVNLADKPLFSTASVPGNLLLSLSVEFPTANTSAYLPTAYSGSTLYAGYFDGAKCYRYRYGPDQTPATTAAQSYFQSYSAASATHTCVSTALIPLWSGNYLNYASMQSLDIFRMVLTGGNRVVDTSGTSGMTILQRSTNSGQDNGSDAPNKALTSTDEHNTTPLSFSSGLNTRVWGAGIKLWITGSGALFPTTIGNAIDYRDSILASMDGTQIYALYMNVRVCDTTVSVESNCVLYGSTYKPEGLMQQYSQTLRYGAFGYLNDSNVLRDGGVLRARMAYIGPQVPVPGAASTTNANPEWDPSTGIMAINPDPADALATNAFTGNKVNITQSGVMNYLNKFGYTSGTYKTWDPISELYYATIRYLKGQSNVAAYTDMTTGSPTSAMVASWVDGFPVITDWTSKPTYDPIIYSCQKNFVLGIGDVNTHRDGNLPHSSLTAAEPAAPPEVSSDTTINVTTATNAVGTMEQSTNAVLGSSYTTIGDYSTYYIAGLAYDAHVPLAGHGVRTYTDAASGRTTISTVSSYWLDVQEFQTYVNSNIYYYATKYGGFTIPSGYTYGTAPTLDSWYNSTNTQGSSNQRQPDNYFTANNAATMQAGLTSAFAKMVSENSTAYGTALAVPVPNVAATGSMSYATNYDPQSWTGQVIGSSVAFASDGTPTLTQQWDARALLSAPSVTALTRQIVTCCTTSTTAPGLAFTNTALTSSSLISRTYYQSFSSVPGVATGLQSVANYIAYLRGDTSHEIANGGAYRTRKYRLGDIVNSKPVTVGPPNYQYYDTYNAGYSAFKTKYAARKNVVFAGANDGMLHAFDGTAGKTSPISGSELFAYIPSFSYGTSGTAATTGLASLGNPNFTHHYLVDAPAGQYDVDFSKTNGGSGAADWHTLLIGGLGKGGHGYYALDVTDPTSWTSEAAVASKVLWEFTDSRLGYTYGTPTVVKTKKYGWVVVFTSGYTNSDGMGYVFFVNPKTGVLLEVVSTPAGSGTTSAPLNLGQQSAYVVDYTDMTADAIYAGDLQGNLWRVDVSNSNTTLPYPTARKLAAFGSSQPITTRPLIEVPVNSNTRYVLVGTGKLLADSDIASNAQQSFYAIVDGLATFGSFYGSSGEPLPTGVSFPITRSELNDNSSLLSGIGSSPASVMGWYFDLPVTSNIAQRVNVDPFANQGIVAFIGNTPSGSACSPSSTGSVYGVNFATGQSVLLSSDNVTITASTSLNAIGTEVTILSQGGSLHIYTGDEKGNAFKPPASLITSAGVTQINWRDVPGTN